ncbi:hypothetical protein ILUMI_09394 [Ignelater luminosus]|uniref:ER membrane protein complex subunit 1 n=1 Tax=Ignelater luminosus TaxID=2038154 RepID=A0A8K0GF33_IGNLU|nr:hypothetical protein ILUMI_09394 [Ignelater luminosus]
MATFKSISSIFLVFLTFLNVAISLYEDQIGKFDWKQSYIGNIKFGSFDSVKRVVVATDENVIASLHLKNGQIAWRQILESPHGNQIELLHVDKEVITVSGGESGWYVRGWELNLGTILWEWTLYSDKSLKGYWVISKDQLIHLVPAVGSHLEITTYEVRTGRNNGKTLRISAPWITDLSKCVTAGIYWTCISGESSSAELHYIDLSSQLDKVYNLSVEKLIGNAPGKVTLRSLQYAEPDILLIRNGVGRYVRLQPELPKVFTYGLSPNVAVAPNGDQTLLIQLESSSENPENIQIHSVELEEGKENRIETDYVNKTGISHIITALCRGSACRVLFSAQDHSISLLQLPAGKVAWTREEALSHIVATEFLELPVSELDASIEHEFDSVSGDVFGTLYHRLTSQARQLSVLLTGQQSTSNTGLVRDEFGLHKLIIVATNVGKLFAIDTITGNVVWSRFFNNVESFSLLNKHGMLLFVQRTARYSPLIPQCVLLMKDKITGNGIMYTFDPITGESLQLERLSYQINQVMLLPYEDDEHLKGLLILSGDSQVHLYPSSSKSILLKHASTTFLYTANPKQGTLHGLSLAYSTPENIKAVPTWSLNLGQAELVAVGIRPINERVHSQGRVLADRSVLYKYVNPNLLAIATIKDDSIHKHVLNIYLVDGVTGLIVYSTVHKRADKPVHLVHSENWLVYSYYNERFRRIELGAIELYEGSVQSNSTAFSSHAVSQLPHAEAQAYIFPGTPLAMQATITERGITNKHILVGLSNGAVTEIPWAFLEPRGNQGILNPEEGYIPYIPELPLPSEATINYNQSLARIRGLQVAPARLESTCLVLVHGLDVYYTRVTPSKTFDLLKEDFDHWLIAIVLIGLTVASYVTKRLASRKALKQAWK